MKKCVYCESIFDKLINCPSCGRSWFRPVPDNTEPIIKTESIIKKQKLSTISKTTPQKKEYMSPWDLRQRVSDIGANAFFSSEPNRGETTFDILLPKSILLSLLGSKYNRQLNRTYIEYYKSDVKNEDILENVKININYRKKDIELYIAWGKNRIGNISINQELKQSLSLLSFLPSEFTNNLFYNSINTAIQTANNKINKFVNYPFRFFQQELEYNIKRFIDEIDFLVLSKDNESLEVLPCIKSGKLSNFFPQYLVINKRRQRLLEAIDEFEFLINNEEANEIEFQNFFKRYPLFLLGNQYSELIPQVPLLNQVRDASDASNVDTILKPDFLVREVGYDTWDIVELKRPSERIVVGPYERPRFSASVQRGVAQLRHYRRYFQERMNRQAVLDKWNALVVNPDLILIIGKNFEIRERSIISELRRTLTDARLVTYNELLEKAKKSFAIFY